MSGSELCRIRASLQRRVVELLETQLPEGWEVKAHQQHILLMGLEGDKSIEKEISLEKLYERVERYPDQRREALYSFVTHVVAGIKGLIETRDLTNQEMNVYPVLRHVSFVTNHPGGQKLVYREHTSESIIAYALDRKEGYLLINHSMLEDAGWSVDQLHTYSLQNLRKLPLSVRTQEVAGNPVHFINPQDGYAASRVLLTELLDQYDQEKKGEALGVAIPHMDVLIIVDIQDEIGMQLLSRLTYDFASKGDIPISPFPFLYHNQTLESYIVVKHSKGK
ncbi:DUF1444 family protein [Brevibacillus sp. SYSU BS000544]|uniref:DUF1444 family protein n=1 Tax=Brevibacillus sp. SYSU BS000544 TaxID=3416443 RepID=UPI003CE4F92E